MTWYQKGLYEGAMSPDEDRTFVKFQLEVRDFSGPVSSSEVFDFTFEDIDFETDVLVPRLQLPNNIKVLGDYFANVNKESAVKSTFRVFIDHEEIIKSAFAGTKAQFNKAKDVTDCVAATPRAGFDISGLKDAAEAEKATKLEEFNAGFTVFDKDYWEARTQFLADIDAENEAKFANEERIY